MRAEYYLNHYICPAEVSLRDFLQLACSRGFVGVGLTERALLECEPKALAGLLRERGLGISTVNSAGYFLHADPEAARRQDEKNRWLLESCATLGGAPLNVIVGGLGHAGGRLSLKAARERTREHLVRFAQQAAQAGVPLLLEPIHPMGMWLKGCVHSLRQSQQFIQGLPGVAITLDCFHSWWDCELDEFLAQEDSPLAVVQICDVAALGDEFAPRRAPPGEGVVDLPGVLRACLARKRPPRLELELFAAQIQGRDLTEVVDASLRHLGSLESALP